MYTYISNGLSDVFSIVSKFYICSLNVIQSKNLQELNPGGSILESTYWFTSFTSY